MSAVASHSMRGSSLAEHQRRSPRMFSPAIKAAIQTVNPHDPEREIDFLRWLVEEAYRWRSRRCEAGEAA